MTHVIIADVEAEELFGRWEGRWSLGPCGGEHGQGQGHGDGVMFYSHVQCGLFKNS